MANSKLLLLLPLIAGLLMTGCSSQDNNKSSHSSYGLDNYYESDNNISRTEEDYDYGYQWASDEDINDFDDCQSQFDTSEAEDGCNDYVQENLTDSQEFMGYECTEDCSGHEAGYEWAEDNGISDEYNCDGNSESFNEGCRAYIEENY